MTNIDLDVKVKFLQGFSNKTRVQILECLKENEKTVSQIVHEVEATQSSISQHLSCLRECGLIVSRQEGKYVYYKIRNEKIGSLLSMFDEVLLDIQQNISSCNSHFI